MRGEQTMAHESGPHCLFAVDQLSSLPRFPSLRRSLSGRPAAARLHLLGSVSGDGLRPVDLSRESARHRGLFGFVAGQALSPGIPWQGARSTLADANESRDWRIFADFAHRLIATARGLYVRDPMGVDLDESLYALDSTTIDLCLALFPWARFRRRKAAVKMHTLLDLRGNIPTFIRVTDGKVHDVNMLDEIMPEAGAFYVMDRGYIDFERLFVLTLSSAFFVVRTKSNVLLQRRYSHPVDKSTGVRSDQTVILSSFESASAYPDSLRRVNYFDADTGKRLKFLTNNFTLPALTIARIYKQRWQVELFFEGSTWCTPSYVMEFQRSAALNRPLVGLLDGFVRPCIARRLLRG